MQPASGYEAEIGRAVERVVIDELVSLASRAGMPQVRAIALKEINQTLISDAGRADTSDRAHYDLLATDIERFLSRPAETFAQPAGVTAPPGAPIGDPGMDWLDVMAPWCSEWGN